MAPRTTTAAECWSGPTSQPLYHTDSWTWEDSAGGGPQPRTQRSEYDVDGGGVSGWSSDVQKMSDPEPTSQYHTDSWTLMEQDSVVGGPQPGRSRSEYDVDECRRGGGDSGWSSDVLVMSDPQPTSQYHRDGWTWKEQDSVVGGPQPGRSRSEYDVDEFRRGGGDSGWLHGVQGMSDPQPTSQFHTDSWAWENRVGGGPQPRSRSEYDVDDCRRRDGDSGRSRNSQNLFDFVPTSQYHRDGWTRHEQDSMVGGPQTRRSRSEYDGDDCQRRSGDSGRSRDSQNLFDSVLTRQYHTGSWTWEDSGRQTRSPRSEYGGDDYQKLFDPEPSPRRDRLMFDAEWRLIETSKEE